MYRNNLKRIREEKGLSLRQLAQKCDISYQTVLNLETGKHNFTPRMLDTMCDVLETDIYELLGTSVFNFANFSPKTKEDIEKLRSILDKLEETM